MESTLCHKASNRRTLAFLSVLVFFPALAFAQATHLKPESLGFSSERLGRLHEAMQRSVDEKSLAGVVTLLMLGTVHRNQRRKCPAVLAGCGRRSGEGSSRGVEGVFRLLLRFA
jgi:hypothetical protein